MDKPLGLGRNKKLKSAKEIEALFTKMPVGQSINRHFLQLRYAEAQNSDAAFKVAVVVSKRLFARAVHRNIIKRRLREAIRLNQEILHFPKGFNFLVIYKSKEILPFEQINGAMKFLFETLNQRINAIL